MQLNMVDTAQSRTSDVAASAATRKRRSSILKSQRPPRTPFCELEFNVCTPTETSKSRRVSFSRRTGVAEFVTNEATTTWKNFYEEHNKSLESSGNDSQMNHGRRPIAHLGKRIFDQQFEEVEAIDFIQTLNPGINVTSSMNNINFTQLECTEVKLAAPLSQFELSAATESQSKLFGDNLPMTYTGEVSGLIDANFSTLQQIGEKDDLDEIQKDLLRHSNSVCHGPFARQNFSEYIEVDLNMTHVAIPNDESDMSITDTIHSPKVQDVSKSCSIDKKVSISNKDWVTDKENIVLNPYIAPRESVNFALTEMPEEVLVFDGKRLIVETENPAKMNYRQSVQPTLSERVPLRKTIVVNCNDSLPNFLEEEQVPKNQSRIIGMSEMKQSCTLEDKSAQYRLDETQNKQRTIIFGDDISLTEAIPNVISDTEKRRTIVYNDDVGNISITQALPTNIIDKEKRRTIVYENNNANISITQAVPANILISNENNEKRKTIVFENEACNISMTQAISTNIIPENAVTKRRTIVLEDGANVSFSQSIPNTKKESNKSRRTVVYEDNTGNISVTQSITSSGSNENILAPKRRTTVVFESGIDNISVTQALPSNIILPQNLNATTFDYDANISMTQAVPANILFGKNTEPNRRRTVVYEDDSGDISITQAVTKNQVIQGQAHQQHLTAALSDIEVVTNKGLSVNTLSSYNERLHFQNNNEDISNTRASINQVHKQEKNLNPAEEIIGNKRRTIVFQNDDADISITQAVPVRQVIDNIHAQNLKDVGANVEAINEAYNNSTNERRTVVFENDDADISMTQAVAMNQVIDIMQKENHIASNLVLQDDSSNKRRTVVFDNDVADISITQAIPMSKVIDAIQKRASIAALNEELNSKRRTIVFENDDADISMTQAIPISKVIESVQKENFNFEESLAALNKEEITSKRRTVVFENDDADISMTRAVSMNQVIDIIQKENYNIVATSASFRKKEPESKRKTIVFEKDKADLSLTQSVPNNQIMTAVDTDIQHITATNEALLQGLNNKRKTLVESDDADLSVAQTVSQVLHKHKDEPKHNESEIENNEISHYDNTANNNAPNIIYDDDEGDISMTRAISSSIILPDGQEKKRTIVLESVESLLENKDLFMEIDRLTDGINENKSSIKVKEEAYDIYMLELSDIDIGGKKAIACNSNDVCVTKANLEKLNKQDQSPVVKIDERASLSKPIPAALVTFQQETIDKSLCKDIKDNDTLLDARSNVLVYQSLTTNTQNIVIKTNQEDSKVSIEEKKVAFEENKEISQSFNKIEVQTHKIEDLDIHRDSSNVELVAETSRHSAVKTVNSNQNSILNDLLDMSQSSFEGTEDKDLMAQISSNHMAPADQADQKSSNDTLFYITKDSNEDRPFDKSETTSNTQEMEQIQSQPALSIEYKDGDDSPIVRDLQTKLATIKNVIREDHVPQSNPNENNKEDTGSKVSLDMSRRKISKTFKMANDTNELLEMLSDFTDKRMSRNFPLEQLKEDNDIPESHLSLENKVELNKPEPARSNRTLNRQSMVLSREDLEKNLSLASEALQKPRSDFDDSDSIEEVKDTPNITKEHRKSVRLSTDVVKTLHFDDDSISERQESIQTPLKKTAFGEISYMKESKSKVIPDFMTVSDGIKELMDDLVKPMAEVQPFTNTTIERNMKNNPSTCSTQIQANLLTSSQIDLHTDLYSTTESASEMNKISSADIITDAVDRSLCRALTSPVKSTPMYAQSAKSSEMDFTSDDTEDKSVKTTVNEKPASGSPYGEVLIFDPSNPLNNVLLVPTPPHAIDIHRYNPIKSNEQLELPSQNDGMAKQDRVTSQYRVELSTLVINQEIKDNTDTQSVTSNTSKPVSIDQSTAPETCNVRDMEINTVIAMKGNEELLEASSSLTLVNDELTRNNSSFRTSTHDTASSPVRVIYKVDETPLTKMDSDFTSTDETDRPLKPKKRIYSPTKREKHENCTLSTLDITPKPITKMQKRSISPDYGKPIKLPAERDKSPVPVERGKSPTRQRSPRRMNKKPGTNITVQQVMMVHVDGVNQDEGQERTDSSTTEPRSVAGSEVLGVATSSEIMSSFTTSSVNFKDETSLGRSSLSGNPSKVEWLPKSISHLMDSIDSGDDIVGTINAMPFMGSPDCQWESEPGSVWSLLLLHARLRLIVRFASAPRLRPDTPVLNVELETLHQDEKNPISYLCAVFAAESMRHHMCGWRGAAGDAGRLVRRLAGVARLAAQWARAMHDARVRLAYSLSHDGWLALKVANTSYRAVWEVTLRLQLVVESARAAPAPRACCVRVSRALHAAPAPPDVARVAAAAPADWGHAPRTIWKVFRYLKHKKRDDDAIPHL